MNILLITDRNQLTGLNYHRLLIPHKHLVDNYDYKVTTATSLDVVSDDDLKDFQIVVFLRLVDTNGRTKEVIDRAKKIGLKVILDIDDYWHLHPKHEMSARYKANKIPEQTVDAITYSDWVTTTTPHFADKIKEFNKNVTVLPNSIDKTEMQFVPNPVESDRTRIGWIGGVFHKEDLKLVYNGFKDVWKKVKHDKFQLCLGGWNYPDRLEYIKSVLTNPNISNDLRLLFNSYKIYLEQGTNVPHKYIFNESLGNVQQYDLIEGYFTDFYKYPKDKDYNEYLQKRVYDGNELSDDKPYKRMKGLTADRYATMYNEIDVSLVPLLESNFNSYKSQIKIIEAGWFKKAAIVSSVMPYLVDCNKGNSILISPSKRGDGWGAAMKSLILNPNKKEDLAEALHEHVVANYDMDIVNKVRNDLYKTLCE